MRLKVKELSSNNRGFTHMAISENKSTLIYLHGLAKDGSSQWYESKGEFTNATALKYFYAGRYKVVFAQGMSKSSNQNWLLG